MPRLSVKKTTDKIVAKKSIVKKAVSTPVTPRKTSVRGPALERHAQNPILEPRGENAWETKAAFNPAAALEDGKVHILYRAIGDGDVSVLGYAVSDDGVSIRERADEPAYAAAMKKRDTDSPRIDYSSGGGWGGGCEDPRITFIDDKGYLIYTAFDGWNSLQIALSTIDRDDFLNKKWNWSEPMILSPAGQIHKNWVLFPEKLNGKFAILHSISPKILIEYVDDLSEFKNEDRAIESYYNKKSATGGWDSWVRGIGPPPIRTDSGWLVLYHAMDERDPNRYKLGAMLLDQQDPSKIIYRCKSPILEPDEWYENDGWKSGVVYSCGAIVKGGTLYVYYGGADSTVSVAKTDLANFLSELKKTGSPRLSKIPTPKSRKK